MAENKKSRERIRKERAKRRAKEAKLKAKDTKKNNNNKTKTVKRKKNGKLKFKDKHPKLMLFIKLMIVFLLLLTVIGAGIVVGYIFGFFGDDFTIDEKELRIAASNSVIVNSDGTQVIAELSGDEKRKIISLSEMADYLPKAYVAIEDERFYKHHGIDIKRTGGAIIGYVIHKGGSYGGSSITQQLVKNITQENDRSIFRKVKEWAKAYQVEQILSKDEILELYLNILFVGGQNIHGVELGAEYYFNKSAKDLDLAECAFLAGINNSPNMYNPYNAENNHADLIKKRTLTVLKKMKDLNLIASEEEYNQAVAKVEEGLKFEKATTGGNVYSYHTDALLSQIIDQVAAEKQISKQLAENYVYSSGLKIYSTQDAGIQSALEEEFAKTSKYSLKSRKTKGEDGNYVTSQAAMVVIDHTTGYVLGTVGGLGEKTESRGLNRATQSTRQTGSSMKPIADVAPGLEEGIITAATEYDDSETYFGNYKPKNYNHFRGVITVRDAIETSQNIPFIKIMAELTPQKAMEYLKKMGVTSLDDTKDAGLSMAIGGLTNGISPLEMAGAYATIANDGVYIQPTFYIKVTDVNGEVVLTPNQKTERVISEANAYIAKNLLTAPVVGGSGTAKYCAIPGIQTSAKTGTTNDDFDRWLCGFTPYYTAATWYGYDVNEEIIYGGTNPAGQLWSNVMKEIHKPLPNADFVRPENIVDATVCTATGGLATGKCANKRTEVFVAGTVPSACEGHSAYDICTESGLLATEHCPNVEKRYFGYSVPKEKLNLWKTNSSSSGKATAPADKCNIHTAGAAPVEEQKPAEKVSQDSKGPVINLNGGSSITLTVGAAYTDPGYTATDDKDGDITSKVVVSGKVDTSKAGTYTIIYKVSDSSGNSTTKKRTVVVKAASGNTDNPETPEQPATPEPVPEQ